LSRVIAKPVSLGAHNQPFPGTKESGGSNEGAVQRPTPDGIGIQSEAVVGRTQVDADGPAGVGLGDGAVAIFGTAVPTGPGDVTGATEGDADPLTPAQPTNATASRVDASAPPARRSAESSPRFMV
jgi:hypothetical protein